MSQLLRPLIRSGAVFGALVLLSQCGGSDITLPSAGAPAEIRIVDGDGQNGSAGAPLGNPLIVKVVDRSGDPIERQRVAFSLEDQLDGASVTPEATTDPDGEARATWVLGSIVGTQAVTARVVGSDNLQARFQAEAGAAQAARLQYVSGDGQTTAVGTGVPNALVVRITDPFGNPVSGVEVQWEPESGSVDPGTSITGPTGETETSWVLGASTGIHTVRALSGSLEGSPVTFTATAEPGTASRLVLVSGNNQSAGPGQELADPLVVRLVDEDGNGVPNRAVSWVVGVGGGSVSSLTSNTEGNGEAQVRWTLGPGTGSNTLNAVVSGVGVVGFRATATDGGGGGGGGSPSQLRFLVQPSDVEEDRQIEPAVQVEILDQNGNRVTDAELEIDLDLIGDDDNIDGDNERARSGVAVFDKLEIDHEGQYRLRAIADGLPSVESNTFTVHERDGGGDGD